MPKFEVEVIEARFLRIVVEAENRSAAEKQAMDADLSKARVARTQRTSAVTQREIQAKGSDEKPDAATAS